MAAVGAIGPIGGFAAAASLPAAGPAPADTAGGAPGPSVSRAASPTLTIPGSALAHPQSSPSTLGGLSELEALAILALLSGNHRNHGADALSAMLIAAALNAYTGVQALISAPGAAATQAGGPTVGPGIDLRA